MIGWQLQIFISAMIKCPRHPHQHQHPHYQWLWLIISFSRLGSSPIASSQHSKVWCSQQTPRNFLQEPQLRKLSIIQYKYKQRLPDVGMKFDSLKVLQKICFAYFILFFIQTDSYQKSALSQSWSCGGGGYWDHLDYHLTSHHQSGLHKLWYVLIS